MEPEGWYERLSGPTENEKGTILSKKFWVNLPVKDIARSRAFFEKLGFSFSRKYGERDDSAALAWGRRGHRDALHGARVREGIAELGRGRKNATEVLLSIDAGSRAEVDEIAKKAADAGGTVFGKPSEIQGWMYGCGFADLDGHRWNMLFRDMSRMPKP